MMQLTGKCSTKQNGATEIVFFASGFKKCVIDVHYYNVYDSMFETMNVDQNIDYVKTVRASHLKNLMGANGALVFVGEWFAEWKVKGASDKDYMSFASDKD